MATRDDPDRHQPAGHRVALRLGVEVRHDPAADRLAARVAIRLASSRSVRRPACSQPEADADGHDGQRAQSPVSQHQQRRPGRGRRAPVGAAAEQGQASRARRRRRESREAGGSEGEALELDAVAERRQVRGDQLARRGRPRACRPRAASARTCRAMSLERGHARRLRRTAACLAPCLAGERRRRRAEGAARPWRSRP